MTTRKTALQKLLILDDTPDIANMVGEIGRTAGFEPRVTTNIDAFHESLQREAPALIVLDLQMPKADGVEVLRQLASQGTSAAVLLVSGMDQRTIDSAERFGRKSGLNMLGSLQKPFVPEALVEKLQAGHHVAQQLSGSDLAAAIDDSALQLHYQPVIQRLNAGVWHAVSAEALPRWQHPSLGLLTAAEFLSLAGPARGELMSRLTDFVLQRGIEQMRVWQASGVHVGLRVNVAAGLVADAQFPDRLEKIMAENNADPSLLTLELADADALCASRDGIEILTRLRLKDINLSMDDFGDVGQSVKPLFLLPVNEVKIDKSVIEHLPGERGARIFVKGIISIARELGIACCAEGVESPEQLDVLDELGCDLAQGFYIGKPARANDVMKTVTSWVANTRKPPLNGT